MVKARPVYLNLVAIRQPLPAVVSILHRVSGALLFLIGIPVLLAIVDTSRRSPDGFAAVRGWFASPFAKLALLALLWAYLHHFCAGVRYLLIDIDVGSELQPARRSAATVLLVSLALTAIIGVRLW